MGAEPKTGAPSASFLDPPCRRPGVHLVMGVRRVGRFLGDKTLLSGAAPGSQGLGYLQADGDQEGSTWGWEVGAQGDFI